MPPNAAVIASFRRRFDSTLITSHSTLSVSRRRCVRCQWRPFSSSRRHHQAILTIDRQPPQVIKFGTGYAPANYATRLQDALRGKDVTAILQCLSDASYDDDFIRSIPPTTFTAIIELMGSDSHLSKMRSTLTGTWWVQEACFPRTTVLVSEFMRRLRAIIDIRRGAGVALGQADYRTLLRCTEVVADGGSARRLLSDMVREGHELDTDSVNSGMHSILWDRQPDKFGVTLSFRVCPFNMRVREDGYLSYAPELGGYKTQVKGLLENLTREGKPGDETTICHLITAFAREGDTSSISDLLMSVWRIDVSALLSAGTQPHPPKVFPAGHILRPTQRLLYTLAHAYGANSAVPTALRLIEFISHTYAIPIGIKVWNELFVWTFVQSSLRSGKFASEHEVNRLDLTAPERLWQTMVSEPYNIRPTMQMYDFFINNLTFLQRYDVVQDRIREGTRRCMNSIRRAAAAKTALNRADLERAAGLPSRIPRSNLLRQRQLAQAAKRRDLVFVRRWCKWYCQRGNGFGFVRKRQTVDEEGRPVAELRRDVMYETRPFWAEEDVPDFIKEFGKFVPEVLKYRTRSGVLAVLVGSTEESLELEPAQPSVLGGVRLMRSLCEPIVLRQTSLDELLEEDVLEEQFLEEEVWREGLRREEMFWEEEPERWSMKLLAQESLSFVEEPEEGELLGQGLLKEELLEGEEILQEELPQGESWEVMPWEDELDEEDPLGEDSSEDELLKRQLSALEIDGWAVG